MAVAKAKEADKKTSPKAKTMEDKKAPTEATVESQISSQSATPSFTSSFTSAFTPAEMPKTSTKVRRPSEEQPGDVHTQDPDYVAIETIVEAQTTQKGPDVVAN